MSQGIDREGKRRLRICGAIAGEPSGKVFVAKLPYYVAAAACGETREVAFRPVPDGRLGLSDGRPASATVSMLSTSQGRLEL